MVEKVCIQTSTRRTERVCTGLLVAAVRGFTVGTLLSTIGAQIGPRQESRTPTIRFLLIR